MRREALQRGIERVVGDLESSGVADTFRRAIRETRPGKEGEKKEWLSLESFQKYSVLVAAYSDIERSIVKIIGLAPVSNPEIWQGLAGQPDRAEVYEIYNRIRFAQEYLPSFANLLRRDYVDMPTEVNTPAFSEIETGLQTVVLTEEGGAFSSPDRLIYVLQAVRDLYGVIATTNGGDEATISVVGLDSGSEKSLDFLGVAKFMQELRETLLAVWHAVIFHKQTAAAKNLALVSDALPIVAKIHSLETDKAIGPEDAARLKNRVLGSVTKFVEAGAVIPEMSASAHFDPQIVMRPQPKLLTGPAPESHSSPSDVPSVAPSESPPGEAAADANTGSRDSTSEELFAALSPEQVLAIAKIVSGEGLSDARRRSARSPKPPSQKKPAK